MDVVKRVHIVVHHCILTHGFVKKNAKVFDSRLLASISKGNVFLRALPSIVKKHTKARAKGLPPNLSNSEQSSTSNENINSPASPFPIPLQILPKPPIVTSQKQTVTTTTGPQQNQPTAAIIPAAQRLRLNQVMYLPQPIHEIKKEKKNAICPRHKLHVSTSG